MITPRIKKIHTTNQQSAAKYFSHWWIHHTKIKDFWVNIFKVAKALNVQVFATTHSDECIEAFVEASNEINHDDIRLIQLQADGVDNKTYASTFKYKNIKAGINSNLKMLG